MSNHEITKQREALEHLLQQMSNRNGSETFKLRIYAQYKLARAVIHNLELKAQLAVLENWK